MCLCVKLCINAKLRICVKLCINAKLCINVKLRIYVKLRICVKLCIYAKKNRAPILKRSGAQLLFMASGFLPEKA